MIIMFLRNNKIIFLFIVIIFFLFIQGIKNTIKTGSSNFALRINNNSYSFTYYRNILEKSKQELEKIKSRKLSYIELIDLERNIMSKIINNELILKESKILYDQKDDRSLKEEFLKMRIFFKNKEFNKRHFYKMIKIYKINEIEFTTQVKNKLVRSLFINTILLNNLLVPGLNEIIVKYDLQVREIELIRIPCCILQIYNHDKISEIKKIYLQNLSKFKIIEKRKIEYMILSTNDIKKSINRKLKKRLNKHLKKNYYFLSKKKVNIFLNYNVKKLNHYNIIKNKEKVGSIKTRGSNVKINELIFFTQNLNIELLSKQKKVIETPLGLKVIKKKYKYFPKKYKKQRVLKDEYIKKLFIDNFINEISIIKENIKKKEKMLYIEKKYNIKLKKISLITNFKQDNYIFNSKMFQKFALYCVLNKESKIFSVSFDKFCIMRVKNIIYNKKEEINNIENIIKEIWKRKVLILKIFFDNKKTKLTKPNIKHIILQKKKMKIFDKKDFQNKTYKKINAMKRLKTNFFTIENKDRFLFVIKIKRAISPKKDEVNKYRRIYQLQIKKVEQQIIVFDILKKAQKKNKIQINPLIKNYILK